MNSTQLTATILPVDVATAGTPAVTVTNLAPGGGNIGCGNVYGHGGNKSRADDHVVVAQYDRGRFGRIHAGGERHEYISTSVVNFNGTARTTTFINASQLTIPVSATDVATVDALLRGDGDESCAGRRHVAAAATFTITAANNPVPTITSLSPNTVIAAGSIAFTLTVNGTNFVSQSGGGISEFGAAKGDDIRQARQVLDWLRFSLWTWRRPAMQRCL